MKEMNLKELTKAEEQIMMVLWSLGKGFVKEVIEQLPDPKPAYNTVSTIIRILEKKGFVGYIPYGKTHEYYPLIEKDAYRKFYLENFMNNYFGGSFQRLVSFFAKDKDISIHEMEEIFKLIGKDLKDNQNG